MPSIRTAISFVSVILLLSACGGGSSGGGQSAAQPPAPSTPNFSVTTSIFGNGSGTISPASSTVTQGGTTSFVISPAVGSTIFSVTGCGGTLSGNTFTTGPVTSSCSVNATFDLKHYMVRGTAGIGGSISPSSSTVPHGTTTSFTVTSDSGFTTESVTGCGGSLSSNVYTTGAITADCSVVASFQDSNASSPVLESFSIDPGTVDVSNGAASVTIRMSVYDPVGVEEVYIRIYNPAGDYWTQSTFYPGTDQASIEWIIEVPEQAAQGEYKVAYITVRDAVGNTGNYYAPDLEQLGFPSGFFVLRP